MHDDQLIDVTQQTNSYLQKIPPTHQNYTYLTTQNTQTRHTRKTNHIRLRRSYSETPTAKLSQYADLILKPLLQKIHSYIQDTTDILKCIFSINNNLPTGIILITIDVKILYTKESSI